MERPFAAYTGDEPYIFVSYSHQDVDIVNPQITRLKDVGYNVWYDEGISPGTNWRDELAETLSRCNVFLFFITQQAARSESIGAINALFREICKYDLL